MKRTILILLFMLVASVFVISNANPGVGEIKADVGEANISILSSDVLLYNQQYVQIQSVVICYHLNNLVTYGVIVTVDVDVQGGHSPPTTTLHNVYNYTLRTTFREFENKKTGLHRLTNGLANTYFV